MRKIKVRAWDTKDKKYLYSEKQEFICTTHRDGLGVTLPYENIHNPDNIDEDCFDWADADLLMGRYELEQSTGLKDRNGKEVYEGDILLRAYPVTRYGETEIEKDYYWVEWSEYEFCWQYRKCAEDGFMLAAYKPNKLATYCEDWEVVGNVHEDKKSLGGKE